MEFNIEKAKDFLKDIIETNRKNLSRGIDKKISVELVGDAGLGKTSAILQLANELGIQFFKLNLSQIEELGDLIGFPVKKFEVKKEIEKNGQKKVVTLMVNQDLLETYLKAGFKPTNRPAIMSYAPPEWVDSMGESGILLLDDYSRADQRFIQATMELIDRSAYLSWSLPKDWHIILTSNPDDGNYMVNSMDDAQKTRFLSATISYDEKIWAEWAEKNKIDSRCINFMLMNPEVVTGTEGKINANPRQWVNFFYSIGNLDNYKDPKNIERIELLGAMAVGGDLTAMFIAYIHNNMDKIIHPEEILNMNKYSDKQMLSMIQECVGTENNYRSDIASILSIRFINYTNLYAETNPIPDDMIKRIHDIIIKEIMGSDITFNIAKKLYYKNKQKFNKLIASEEFRKYIFNN